MANNVVTDAVPNAPQIRSWFGILLIKSNAVNEEKKVTPKLPAVRIKGVHGLSLCQSMPIKK